jgi:hypothetical protein
VSLLPVAESCQFLGYGVGVTPEAATVWIGDAGSGAGTGMGIDGRLPSLVLPLWGFS